MMDDPMCVCVRCVCVSAIYPLLLVHLMFVTAKLLSYFSNN